jgi:general secretion pathway protein G
VVLLLFTGVRHIFPVVIACVLVYFAVAPLFTRRSRKNTAIPAQAGIQTEDVNINSLDPRLRGDDGKKTSRLPLYVMLAFILLFVLPCFPFITARAMQAPPYMWWVPIGAFLVFGTAGSVIIYAIVASFVSLFAGRTDNTVMPAQAGIQTENGQPIALKKTSPTFWVILAFAFIFVVFTSVVGTLVVQNAWQGKQLQLQKQEAFVYIKMLEAAVERYTIDVGQPPTTEQGLRALLAPPSELQDTSKWNGPYIKPGFPFNDPWGMPYLYVSPGKDGRDFDIFSFGPDCIGNTEDDIVSWGLERRFEGELAEAPKSNINIFSPPSASVSQEKQLAMVEKSVNDEKPFKIRTVRGDDFDSLSAVVHFVIRKTDEARFDRRYKERKTEIIDRIYVILNASNTEERREPTHATIKARMRRAVNEVLGDSLVWEVLFTDVVHEIE